jgi:hypothetical protein
VPLTTRRRGTSFLPPNQLPVSNLASNSRPDPTQTTTKPILLPLFFAPLPLLETFLRTSTPLNLHKCLPTGGFLQTAVSDAPRTTSRAYCPLTLGRVRYSTSVSDRFQLSDEQEIDEMRVLHYESDGLYSEFRSYGDLAMSGDTYEVIQKSA